MNIPIVITTDKSLVIPVGNYGVESIALCAAGATSTLEVFDGAIGTIATEAIAAGGTLYAVGDIITLVQAGGGVQASYSVASVDAPETGVITGVTLISGGTGYTAGATYATTTDSVAGSGATITASTVTDAGTSIGKISVTANLSDSVELCSLITKGVSARITGSGAKGFIYYN